MYFNTLKINNLSNSNDTLLLEKYISNKHEINNFEDAGTPLRFFISMAAAKGLENIIDGNNKLKQRPIKELLHALEFLGAQFEYLEKPYNLPLKVTKKVDFTKTEVNCSGTESSQFISSLMLIAPCFENGLTINFNSGISSFSYIKMTYEIMKNFGFQMELFENKIQIKHDIPEYKLINYVVENDWSSAAFFIAYLSKIRNKKLILNKLYPNSNQGDILILKYLKPLGLKYHFENNNLHCHFEENHFSSIEIIDIKNCLDLFPILCTTYFIHQKEVKFVGVKNLIYKESNRIESVRENLKIFGGNLIQEDSNSLILKTSNTNSEKNNSTKTIKSFNDHRIVMSFSFFKMFEKIEFDNPSCVNKSFPNFWEEFDKIFS